MTKNRTNHFLLKNQNSMKFCSIHPSYISSTNLYNQKSNESLSSQNEKSKFHEINPRIFMTKNRTNHFLLKNQNSMKFRSIHPSQISSTNLYDQKSNESLPSQNEKSKFLSIHPSRPFDPRILTSQPQTRNFPSKIFTRNGMERAAVPRPRSAMLAGKERKSRRKSRNMSADNGN